MNTTAIAAALRALADAIETPSAPAAAPPVAPSAETASAAHPPKRGPGRPPSALKPAASAPAPTAPAPTPTPAPTPVAPSAASASAGTLTHAIVANDFKAAALAHGRDFVKGLLDKHQAPTFDKVKDLAAFQAQLKAGPQAAPAPTGAADDLLG